MALTDRELAALKKKTLAQMSQDRQRLLVRFPFTGGILMRLEFVPVRDRRLRTAATDGERVFMDIAFCARLSAEERLFVLAHEAWHCVLMHMLRCQTRNPRTFNIATDMEVNHLLQQEGLAVAPWCLLPRHGWETLSAEEIYEHLRKRKEPPTFPSPLHGEPGDGGSPGQFDRHIYGPSDEATPTPGRGGNAKSEEGAEGGGGGASPPTDPWGVVGFDPDFAPLVSPELADTLRERIVAVAQQVQRTRGDLPAHIEHIVRATLRPQIRWQETLAQFVTSCYGGSRHWLPPSRRHLAHGLYLQSARQDRLRAVVVIDSSGSTAGDLPQFFTELQSLLGTFGSYELTVIQCDCEIKTVETFDDLSPLPPGREWTACGLGGTDFRPPFDYVASHSELSPSCLVYLTDGCGPAPDQAPPYPVLWLLTSDGTPPAPWGTVAWLRPS